MTTTASTDVHDPAAPVEHVDVLIVGAGLSGIGAACHLQTDAPGTSYAILEAREASGGTWDLFRYPGVRSDSDMFTLGYAFRPWTRPKSIADGGDILAYVRETAAEYGVDQHIRCGRQVTAASWSSQQARWTVTVEHVDTGERSTRTCGFLYLCSGYYRYDQGYTPEWPGREDFGGLVVHPQHWPTDLDVTGKRVVVIGSGATAVTLVPALASTAAKVTMLQRSPSYLMPLPGSDPVADLLRRFLPAARAYRAIRWKNVKTSTAMYEFMRKRPARTRALLRRLAVKRLPAGFDVDTHFRPSYDPWDQRMCLVPGRRLLRARSARGPPTSSPTTSRPSRRTGCGCARAPAARPMCGHRHRAQPAPLGGIALTVDGDAIAVSETVAYKGMMLAGVPNMAFTLGYTNASWTLKVDLVSSWVARLLRTMRQNGQVSVTPVLPDTPMVTAPFIEMTSGYFERSRAILPRQGDRSPWRLQQHYKKDSSLFRGPVTDDALQFRA